MKAYKTFVRPILEYGSSVWNPYLIADIDKIESVQRNFTKKICFRSSIPFSSYKDRLKKLSLHSLEYRRLQNDLIMVYKIIHRLVDLPFESLFSFYISPYDTRSHRYCLKSNLIKDLKLRNFFSKKVIPTWNDLPKEIVCTNNLSSFCKKLKQFDLYEINKTLRF